MAHVVLLTHPQHLDPNPAEPRPPIRALAEQVPQVVHEEVQLVSEVGVGVGELERGVGGSGETLKGWEGGVAELREWREGRGGGGGEERVVHAAAEALVVIGELGAEVRKKYLSEESG